MHNYRRFYMRKAFLEWPWIGERTRRNYMLGCLKAFAKSGFQRTFYDLGRVGYWGPQTKKTVDFGFAREHARPDAAAIAAADEGWVTMHGPKIEMRRRKGEELAAAAIARMAAEPGEGASLAASSAAGAALACGGGSEQLGAAEAARF